MEPTVATANKLVFYPLLYVIWSDAVLREQDWKTLQSFIGRAAWLDKESKSDLLKRVNPTHAPDRQEVAHWFRTVKHLVDAGGEYKSLTDLALALAEKQSPPEPTSDTGSEIAKDLQKLEEDLGIVGISAIYRFKEDHPTQTTAYGTETAFSVQGLARFLDGDQAEIIRQVKDLIRTTDFDYVDPGDLTRYREQVLTWCKIVADAGFGKIGYPVAQGGKDDMEAYFSVMETLSYRDLSMVIKFGVQFGLWGMSILSLGTQKHHAKYLPQIGTLELPGCFAMTETNHGSNVRGIETTATYNHAEKTFTIHTPHRLARKEYIGNAALHGRMATVFAKLIIDGTDYGVSAFVVPLRDAEGATLPGIHIEDCGRKMGLNGVDNGLIEFDQVVIPRENMLDRFASVNEQGEFETPIASDNKRFFTMLGTLVGGRIGIPRSAIAASKSGLAIAIRYGDQRRQFGPEGGEEVPILNYRMHQRRLMPLLAKTYAGHFAMQYMTRHFMNRKESEMQELEALAAGLKSYITWNTTATLQECREACGGKGYLSENRIDALKNDTDIYTTFEGDNTVLMQLVAKSRLSAYREQFENMNFFTIVNYVASKTKTSLTEKNPLIVRNTDESHLTDPDFQLNAFEYRANGLVDSAARRMRRLISEGMDPFDAFNVCQHHFVNVGKAFIEKVVLEQFIEAAKTAQKESYGEVLKKLCDLYALHTMEENKGWYLEQGYMEGVKTKAIRKLINQLCWEIRRDAVPLVNAFDIPESCLAAPILTNPTQA
ncbi:Acyl-coenzyme A oxidase 1, peroxisomal [Lunatimonas lonarensis]|uniref:acyl-CoA oxidase n=1 Tax=Lunatimonas lonarensis TaxID=1232681 RepID=R7ZV92_9BACT|nr:acyl-CoA dehydrogenase [Lunatimonas lonarensis]EON77924.1 Acyl-coenzyme A oxidase 1, peroxisomal [Lunatimonas lonarensis]